MTPLSNVTSKLPDGDPFAARPPAKSAEGEAATKETFLKLLVAQIKHQNPLNPADGIEFVAQLAQFTQLEQTIGMASNLDAMRQDLKKIAATADGTGNAAEAGS
jgi:flagellar basal-body rod modification protein FlgD